MKIRRAENRDLDFIVESIVESEKSGTDILSWQRILNLSEFEVLSLIKSTLEEEIVGQEWHLPHFWIAEDSHGYVGALSSWIEAIDGTASGILKTQVIYYLVPEAWNANLEKLTLVQKLNIPRLPLALQLEHIYIRSEHRGKGLGSLMIEKVISAEMESEEGIEFAEIQLMSENVGAL